jgi:hypothetical protein
LFLVRTLNSLETFFKRKITQPLSPDAILTTGFKQWVDFKKDQVLVILAGTTPNL